jgi:hypothetical protein
MLAVVNLAPSKLSQFFGMGNKCMTLIFVGAEHRGIKRFQAREKWNMAEDENVRERKLSDNQQQWW